MTNDVPDTGLVKAFLPLKPGGSEPKPSCSNCPCGTKGAIGAEGKLVCTRFPPELTLLTVFQQIGPPKQVPNVSFKPVRPAMVCWEHPAMQVRMERAILAAHDRLKNAERLARIAAADSVEMASHPGHMEVLRPGSATEHYDPLPPRERPLRSGAIDSDVNPMDEAALNRARKGAAESAASQEADGRKPGDEP